MCVYLRADKIHLLLIIVEMCVSTRRKNISNPIDASLMYNSCFFNSLFLIIPPKQSARR